MFVFDDINKLADKDVQTVLKNVETSQWAMALKGASDTLKTKIFSNLSQRAAETGIAADLLAGLLRPHGPAGGRVERFRKPDGIVLRGLEDDIEARGFRQMIAVIGGAMGPLTGFAMNPARDLGPQRTGGAHFG